MRPPLSRYLVILATLLGQAGCRHSVTDTLTRESIASTVGFQPSAVQAHSAGKHYEAARAAFMAGDMAKADLEVKLALQENPLDAASHFLLGCMLEQKGLTDQSIVGFQRAAAIEPSNPETLYNLGTMLLRRGEAIAAARLLEKAVILRPDHIPTYNNLAKAYFLADLPELAVAAYDEALSRDTSNVIARKNRQVLTRIVNDAELGAASQKDQGSRPIASAVTPLGGAAAPKVQIRSARPYDVATDATGNPQVVLARAQATREDTEANELRDLLRDFPYVTVERRAGRLTISGWTSGPRERALLDRILGKPSEFVDKKAPGPFDRAPEVLDRRPFNRVGRMPEVEDLTTDDTGDHNRMIEVDAIIFEAVQGPDTVSCGFNFLNLIKLNFNYFALDNNHAGTGYTAPPDLTGIVTGMSQWGWITSAAASYDVNIANADIRRVAVLAQPHLTALSGTQAKSIAGGELIYKVSGLNSGDIKPYPFGTTLNVTPTLLRTPGEDGRPRVHVVVEAGRSSVLNLFTNVDPSLPTAFDKVTVNSQAVLSLGQTLILSGISLREVRTQHQGVPGLMSLPIVKHFFANDTTIESQTAVVVLLTPRDPAFSGQQNQLAVKEFIEKRRALIKARQGTEDDMRCFRERYPDWDQLPPNRFTSQIFLMKNSEIYRSVAGTELTSEDVDLELLGPKGGKRKGK